MDFKHIRMSEKASLKRLPIEDQDGRGVGGCGVHLSLWIHQEYTFKHRSACRTPAERGQEDLTSGKQYIEPRKTWYDEGTRGKKKSINRTGPSAGGESETGF